MISRSLFLFEAVVILTEHSFFNAKMKGEQKMINTEITTKGMEKAKKCMDLEKKKVTKKGEKTENVHKYMMGNIVRKYFTKFSL